MSGPDFATIINDACYHDGQQISPSPAVLAAKVPELCPDCLNDVPAPDPSCTHNDCPTIAKLLAIGAAVMSRKIGAESPTFDGYSLGMVEDWTDGANWMLAALRAVQP